MAETGFRESGGEVCRIPGEKVAALEQFDVRKVGLMQIKVERTLLRVGEDSFAVTLPKAWVTYKQLRHGDVVEVIVNDEITIRTKAELSKAAEPAN